MPGYYRDPRAPTPNNPRAIGAAALIVRDGSLLLDCRADDGTWGLPAGRVEGDEVGVVRRHASHDVRKHRDHPEREKEDDAARLRSSVEPGASGARWWRKSLAVGE